MSTEEFRDALKRTCVGKPFREFPAAFKAYVASAYRTVDIDGKRTKNATTYVVNRHSQSVREGETRELLYPPSPPPNSSVPPQKCSDVSSEGSVNEYNTPWRGHTRNGVSRCSVKTFRIF